MRKVVMCITLVSLLLLFGCGTEEKDTTVKVEIESIPGVTNAVEEVSATAENANSQETESTAVAVIPSGATEAVNSVEEEPEAVTDTDSSDASLPNISVAYYGATAKGILETAKAELKLQGYNLSMVECSDFTKPNEMVQNGEADASLCENQAFLDSYNMINGTDLSIVERVYLEPLAIFPGKAKDLNHLEKGITVVVPAGEIGMARALQLLEQKGIIELRPGSGYQACPDDVEKSPFDIRLDPVDFENAFPDRTECDLFICDYNRALLEGINPDEALGYENRNSKLTDLFAICLVSSYEKKDSEKISNLSKALNSENVEEYINENFYHSVIDYR